MTTATDIHVGDVGTVFLITIMDGTEIVNLSSGSSGSNVVLFRKPDGNTISRQASFYTNGTDGKIKYTSVLEDIDQPGLWKISARVNSSSGTWTATAIEFTVRATFS